MSFATLSRVFTRKRYSFASPSAYNCASLWRLYIHKSPLLDVLPVFKARGTIGVDFITVKPYNIL